MIGEHGEVWIYAVEAVGTDRVKIGQTTDVQARLQALQTASPVELRLLGVQRGIKSDEGALHRRFAASWIRGEWFILSAIRDDLFSFMRPATTSSIGSDDLQIMTEFGRREDDVSRYVRTHWTRGTVDP